MNRRSFLLTTAACFAAKPTLAMQPAPELIQEHLDNGKTVFIDFTTVWCTTCAAQKRVMSALRSGNPAYDENIEFVTVDFDDYRKHPFTKALNIPRRSTLVVLKGDAELGRIVAGTSTADIQSLMDTALQAAMAS